MDERARPRVHEDALEVVIQAQPQRPASRAGARPAGPRAPAAPSASGAAAATARAPSRAACSGVTSGRASSDSASSIAPETLSVAAVRAELLDELRAEDAHAGDPLIEAQRGGGRGSRGRPARARA